MRSTYGLDVPRDADWRLWAACRGHDPEMWSLLGGWRGERYRQAHEICDTCPVTRECEELAENTGSWGMIFGGLDFTKPSEAAPVQMGVCQACDRTYEQQAAWSRYCSTTCRNRYYELKRRDRRVKV